MIYLTFSNQIKEELCELSVSSSEALYAKAYGMLSFGKCFSVSEISLHTTNKQIADLYAKMIYSLVRIETSITTEEYIKDNKKTYVVSVDTLEDRLKVLSFFGHNKSSAKVHLGKIKSEQELKSFLAGAFIVCGNISNPKKSYHLEFICPTSHHKKIIESILSEINITLSSVVRRKSDVAYTKDSKEIEDILTFMGAIQSVFAFMDVKIYKDLRNNANRVTNCETANIEKTVSASSAKINDIKYLNDKGELENLPESLKIIARLRFDNPELSLRELAELAGDGISKSGINHRLEKISKIANELRKSEI